MAAIVGDNVGYWFGRELGRGFLQRYGPVRRFSDRVVAPRGAVLRQARRQGDLPRALHGRTSRCGRVDRGLREDAVVAGSSSGTPPAGSRGRRTVGLVAYYFGRAAADAIAHYGLIGAVVALGTLAAAVVGVHFWRKRVEDGSEARAAQSPQLALCFGAGGGEAAPSPVLDHVVVIVFENERAVRSMPTRRRRSRRSAALRADHAATPASPTRACRTTSRSSPARRTAITATARPARVTGSTIGTADARRPNWAAYGEGYPSSPRFAKKHVPFLYFARAQSRLAARASIRALARLRARRPRPLRRHARLLGRDRRRLAEALRAAAARASQNSVVFVVFDEGTTRAGGGGRVVALGARAPRFARRRLRASDDPLRLLRTIEDAWGLPRTGPRGDRTPIQANLDGRGSKDCAVLADLTAAIESATPHMRRSFGPVAALAVTHRAVPSASTSERLEVASPRRAAPRRRQAWRSPSGC